MPGWGSWRCVSIGKYNPQDMLQGLSRPPAHEMSSDAAVLQIGLGIYTDLMLAHRLGDDEEEKLFLFVQNQKVMGAQELGRVEVGSDKMKQLLKDGQRKGGDIQWSAASFPTSFPLIPRGQIWVTAVPVEEEYHGYSELATC
eukprot:symbB.v1.2.010722.t1/scaffold703.1/size171257/8